MKTLLFILLLIPNVALCDWGDRVNTPIPTPTEPNISPWIVRDYPILRIPIDDTQSKLDQILDELKALRQVIENKSLPDSVVINGQVYRRGIDMGMVVDSLSIFDTQHYRVKCDSIAVSEPISREPWWKIW